MKILFIFLLFLSLSWADIYAQLNESDTVKLQLRATLTGNYQKGNVEALTIRGKLDFTISPAKRWAFKSQNSSLYQAFYQKKTDNDLFSRNYLYYNPTHKVYPFAMAYISANYRRKINNRYFAGAGVTFQLVNKTNMGIKLSASSVYERSLFNGDRYNDDQYDGDEKIDLWRETLYISGWVYFFQKHLRVYYDAYWQPAFNNRNNYRTQYDIGIDFPVWRGLSVTSLYTFTQENVVIKNIKQQDRILTFGLAYNIRK